MAEIGHLLGAFGLALAVALATRRRAGAMRALARAQSATVAVAAAWQGFVGGSAAALGLAFGVLLAGGAVLPWALGRDTDDAPADAPRAPLAVAGSAALVLLALLAAVPAHPDPSRENLALALAAVLVALFALATRRGAAGRLAGFWTLANGVALAAIPVATPFAALAVVALFGLVAAGAAAREGAAP
jgi:hydrogenase-4 membrane subunit HyfE